MKRIVSFITVLLVSLFMISSFSSSVVYASADQSSGGVNLSIQTDKDIYESDDEISVSITVENANLFAINDATIYVKPSEGLIPISGKLLTQNISLSSGETYKHTIVLKEFRLPVNDITDIIEDEKKEHQNSDDNGENLDVEKINVPKNNDDERKNTNNDNIDSSPKTGDDFNVWIPLTLMLFSCSFILIIIRRTERIPKRSISFVLCVCIAMQFIPVQVFAKNAQETTSVEAEKVITINEKDYTIKAEITFQVNLIDITTYYENLLGISNDIDLTDANNNNIPDALESKIDIDSDGDGLTDWFEKLNGTNPDNVDTDGDGLSDGYEIRVLKTSAVKEDTDDNGIKDSEEDFDRDELSNLKESKLNTNPWNIDTDNDKLSDFDEVSRYSTNPLLKDSDNDGLDDYNELAYNMNPNNPDTLNDGIKDGDRNYDVNVTAEVSDNSNVKAKIEVNLKGNQIESLTVNKVDNNNVFLNDSVPGYIGNAYELNVEETFDSATLSFELEKELFDNPNFNPRIYYWDSDDEVLTEIPNQSINDNVISANLEHFSSYMVLNKTAYESAVLEFEIEAPTEQELQNKTFDVILTLDESGSISSSDFSLMKERCLELLLKLAQNDRIGVITFDDNVRTILSLSDKESAETTLANLSQHDGATALYDAVDKAITSFDNNSDSSKIIIALTDGEDNSSSVFVEDVTNKAKARDTILYTVGVGSYVNSEVLKEMAEATGGQYYPVENFDNLSVIFERIISNADLYKDSDEDGLSDYHEKSIANGKLKMGNGTSLPKFDSLSYLNSDSDSDDLFDGEEIEIKERIINGKTVYYCYMYSNPCMSDSDSDKLNDYVEIYAGFNPLVNDSVSKNIKSSSFSTNSFQEWLEMVKEKSWNAMHIAVERDVVARYQPGMKSEIWLKNSAKKNIKRIDLLFTPTSEIWEVKPSSYQFSPMKEAGIDQIKNYIALAKEPQNNLILSRGKNLIKGNTISVGNYIIEYRNMNNGLITYHFKKDIPIPVLVPAVQPDTEGKKVNETEWYEWLWQKAKNVGYDVQAFGNEILSMASELGQEIQDHFAEIVAVGIEIGGILGILYIIYHIIPLVLVFA